MPKQNFFVTEEELDNFQIQLLQKRIDRSMIVSGCAGSGKSILALWKAKHIQDLPGKPTYVFIVYTKALHKFMSDGIKAIGLNDNNFTYYHEWKKNGCPSADFIIVDEVQDFTREEISKFKQAAKKVFFFWGDSAQALYRNLKPTQNILTISAEAGIQSEPLMFNYRLPAKIARIAEHLGDDKELVRRCQIEGSEMPRILHYSNIEEQLDMAIQQIKNRQITDAAVLLPTNAMVKRAYDYLKSKGNNIEAKFDDKHDFSNSQLDLNFESDNPKLMTYHSAKGLQFEAVFLPECNLPEKMGRGPLYVAITRSYRYLFIMYSDHLTRFFDAVPKDLYSTSLGEAKIEL